MLYWPVVNMLVWGFTSNFLVHKFTSAAVVGNVLLAGVLLMEIFTRSSITMLMLFLEEIWSRNLGHLFASPLRLREYTLGLVLVSFTRVLLSVTPAILIAWELFGFSLFSLGWPLLPFVLLLALSGFWYGLLILALLFRHGLAAEWLAWMATWLLTPMMAAYYPVSVLPRPLQMVAHALPGTYVFESMKSLLATGELHPENLWAALALNLAYLPIAGLIFWKAYQGARRRGGLLQMGE